MGTASNERTLSCRVAQILKFRRPLLTLTILLLSTISILSALFVSPPGIKTPIWVRNIDGNTWLHGVATDATGAHFVVGTQSGQAQGGVYYFDNNGTLLWKYSMDRGISSVAISADGAYIVAGGYQLTAGHLQVYQNGAIYYLTNQGDLLWTTYTGSQPVFQVKISSNGSRILANYNSGLILFDNSGRTLWNHTIAESGSLFGSGEVSEVAMSRDGSVVLAGENSLRLRNQTNYEWSLLLFDARGVMLWNYTSSEGLGTYGLSLAGDGSYIATGLGRMGYHGTLFLFDKSRTLLWSHEVYSNLLSSQVSEQGNVAASTNVNLLYYNQTGNLIWNYTGPNGGPTPTMTPNGQYVLGTTWANFGSTALLFDAEGNVIWSSEVGTVHGAAMSQDGAIAIIAGGPTQGGPTSLYYFSRTQNGNFITAAIAWSSTALEQPFSLLVEVGVAGLGLTLLSVAGLRVRRIRKALKT